MSEILIFLKFLLIEVCSECEHRAASCYITDICFQSAISMALMSLGTDTRLWSSLEMPTL